jgi:hypothetical protein
MNTPTAATRAISKAMVRLREVNQGHAQQDLTQQPPGGNEDGDRDDGP